jgi:YHS domain-containing protein
MTRSEDTRDQELTVNMTVIEISRTEFFTVRLNMTDPVCGMEVEPSTAAGKYEYSGQTYFFCSHHCLVKFKEDPDKFLKRPTRGHPGP